MSSILYIIPYPKFFSQHSGVGGHIAHAAGILQGFTQLNYDVTVLSEEEHDIFQLEGISLELLPCPSSSILVRQFWAIKLLRHVKRLIDNKSFDCCYIRYSASFAPWVPTLKRLLGDTPLIIEVNSLGSQWRSFLRPIDRRALCSADKIISISEMLESFIHDLLGDEQVKDIRVVMNGVTPERFDVEPTRLGGSGTLHAGFAGLLKADYGIETLLEAARELSDWPICIHIFGDGPYRKELQSISSDLNNVYFHGPIPFKSMPTYLKGLDVQLYTTAEKHLYQSPTKLFEYMAAGRAIVTARTPQTESLLEDAITACFYDVGNVRQLSQALINMSENPELRESLAMNAKKEAESKHSWSSRVEEIISDN